MLWYLKWGEEDSKALVAENLAWLSAFYDSIAPYALPQTYQNFTDPSLTDYLLQYYGSNLPRLERIKSAVDPTQVFNFPQAIPPYTVPVTG
jgi:FAD/FMN-containing dehydrogenase